MQQHIYYIKYALRFADMQIPELVTVFNDQVQSRGWSSMRATTKRSLTSSGVAASIPLPLPMEKLFLSLTLLGTTWPAIGL